MDQSPIAVSEYDNFRRYLEDACGIVLGENKHYLVTSRLKRVTEEFSFPSLSEMMSTLVKGNDRHLREKVIDAPASVSVLEASDLQNRTAASVSDFVKNILGDEVNYNENLSLLVDAGFADILLNAKTQFANAQEVAQSIQEAFNGTWIGFYD